MDLRWLTLVLADSPFRRVRSRAASRSSRSRGRGLRIEPLEPRLVMASDFGDAPDLGAGVGVGDYQTLFASGGPSHLIDSTATTLFLGAAVDSEANGSPNSAANGDDRFVAPARDDEDGLVIPAVDLNLTIGGAPTVAVRATNLTGVAAMLSGWIDYNRDGVFDNASERAQVAVPNGSSGAIFQLTFPEIPLSSAAGATYARFRLSTDSAAEQPGGPALDGEVEDYVATLQKITGGVVESLLTKRVAQNVNGGPSFNTTNTNFAFASTSLGDLDGDGVPDLAVGDPLNDQAVAAGSTILRTNAGAIYVLLMNADGSVKNHKLITSGNNGGPSGLLDGDFFGASVANIGDIDGDGVVDLAVGAHGDDTRGSYSGAVYILRMNANGTVKTHTKVTSSGGGSLPIAAASEFLGRSIAALGDFDGDGVGDVLVGAPGADTGATDAGAAYVLLLNSNGTAKAHVRLASGVNGAPSLALNDSFGNSVAALGDLDGDGITDVAVGATKLQAYVELTGGNAVYVLLMNSNGTVKASRKITSNSAGAGANPIGFGWSLGSTGDLDGDGVDDLAVGSALDDLGGANRGSVRLVYLNRDGSAKASRVIGSSLGGGPALSNGDNFGASVTAFPDLNGDGIGELIVGATNDSGGAFYTLFLGADTQAPGPLEISRQSPASATTSADSVTFRVTFAEDVFGVDTSDFVIDSTSTATVTNVTQVSRTLYDVTLSGGDLADFNGTVGLNLAPTATIQDRSGNLLSPTEPPVDELYTLENIAPVLAITRQFPAASTTSADTVRFRLTFSEPVQNVSPSDFVVTGATVTTALRQLSASVYDLTLSGGNLANFVGEVGLDLAVGQNITDLAGNPLPNFEPGVDETFLLAASTLDFGDAPDTGPGFSLGNYATTLADNGPRHTVTPNLRLGALTDTEPDAVATAGAQGDDLDLIPGRDDEDSIANVVGALQTTIGGAPTFTLRATNITGTDAQLYGWIDYNRDGVFDDATERAMANVPTGSNNALVSITLPVAPLNSPLNTTVARFRLSTDPSAATSTGYATDGEVEDYPVALQRIGDGLVVPAKNREISTAINGGLLLPAGSRMGTAVAALGDIDGDGVGDLAVNSVLDPTGFTPQQVVQIALLNADGTVKGGAAIGSQLNGGPLLGTYHRFGDAIEAIGDLDGDGITELAVGDYYSAAGGPRRGTVHILFLNPDGTARKFTKLASGMNGTPPLADNDQFGHTIEPLGDVDGDGLPDIAVGLRGSSTNAMWLLNLNADGTVKQFSATTPTDIFGQGVVSFDPIGRSVARLGDLDGDGIGDVLVGDPLGDIGGYNRGAARVLLLNADRSVKQSILIASGVGGAPTLSNSDQFGSSVALVGDLDGDGLNEIAIGARNANGVRGALHLLTLRANPSLPAVNSITRLTPSAATTNADALTFRVSFNLPVTGVDATDFLASGVATDVTGVTALNSSTYDVTLSGGTLATFSGAVGLNLAYTQNITDLSSRPVATAEPIVDEIYTLDNTAPVVSITRLAPATEVTGASAVKFRARFSEPVLNVVAADFQIAGPTAMLTVVSLGGLDYELTVSGGSFTSYAGTVGINIAAGHNIADLVGNFLPTVEPTIDETFTRILPTIDFGDAPDTTTGVGFGNYATKLVDNGPRHTIVSGLFLGAGVDGEFDANWNFTADGDDRFAAPDRDDEQGVIHPATDLALNIGTQPTVAIRATNLTASVATVYGWIDYNRDGVFNDSTERASASIAAGTTGGIVTLTFPTVPLNTAFGTTFARFRFSTDAAAANSTGAAFDGEVEDYAVTIFSLSDGRIDGSKNKKIMSVPVFGLGDVGFIQTTTAGIGDVDGDGISDLAIGSYSEFAGGALYLALMNAKGSVKSGRRILVSGTDDFGTSIAAIGDLDGDGRSELAVGDPKDDLSGTDRGAIHILSLNADLAIKSSLKIASGQNGGPGLSNNDQFGAAITAYGDLDNDGVPDLVVGAPGDDTNRGAAYVLYLQPSGAVRSAQKIASGVNGGPALLQNDRFGHSLATVGDLNGDGRPELAVGAPEGGGVGAGAVYMLSLTANGAASSSLKIASGQNGGPVLPGGSYFGSAVAGLGDVDGDGLPDLAVGASREYSFTGAVYVMTLSANGSAKTNVRVSSGVNGGPNLQSFAQFGSSIGLVGDINADGFKEIAVSVGPDFSGFGSSVHLLSLRADAIAPAFSSIRRQSPTESTTGADSLVFRATFSEPTRNVNAADFQVVGGSTATIVSAVDVSGGVYDLTLAGGNLAYFNGSIGLNLASGHNITDRLGTPLPLGEPPIDETYILENALPGDYDRDTDIDLDDHTFWLQNFGAVAGIGLQADGNGDGVVDAADYTLWRDNFAAPASSLGTAASTFALTAPSDPLLTSNRPLSSSAPVRELGPLPQLHNLGQRHRDTAFAEISVQPETLWWKPCIAEFAKLLVTLNDDLDASDFEENSSRLISDSSQQPVRRASKALRPFRSLH